MAIVGTKSFLGDIAVDIGNLFLGTESALINPYSYYDEDAQAFINATGITGSAADAVTTLVTSLKAEGLWTVFDAIYPMVGANATAHKYNLKNPQDTDAAYRLNFSGSWTHNSDGAKPDGGAGTYANTYFNPSLNLTTANGSFSYFSFTNSSADADVEIGAQDTGGPGGTTTDTLIATWFTGNRTYFSWGGEVSTGLTTNSIGFYITNAQTSTTVDLWKNGTEIVNNATSPNRGMPNLNVYIGAGNYYGNPLYNSTRGCSFATIGDTIPSGKEATFSTIVNTFQSNLGRYTY